MKTINELILERLKEEFEVNGYNPEQHMFDDNVWVMAASVIPFEESAKTADFLPYPLNEAELRQSYLNAGRPTHIVRVVLRTSGSYGICEYVDGTDIYFSVDLEEQSADCTVWSDTWIEGPPKFEGGTIQSSITWCRRMAEPFSVQLEDPFLCL